MIVEILIKFFVLVKGIISSWLSRCRTLKLYGVAIVSKISKLFYQHSQSGKFNQLFLTTTLLCSLQFHAAAVVKYFVSICNALSKALKRYRTAVNFSICTFAMTLLLWYYVYLPLEEQYSSAYLVSQKIDELDKTQCFKNFVFNRKSEKFRLPFMTDDDTLKILKPGKNIFYHLTSCIYDGVVDVNPRQACAIESAARINTHLEIFLVFTSQVGFLNQSRLPIIDVLLSYPNVHIRNIDIEKYAENTPAQEWIKEKKLYQSNHFHSHVSDFLRFVSLNRWGGTYLDLDTIMLKNISLLGDNFVGAESSKDIASAVLNINIQTEIGRKVADDCVASYAQNFNPNAWSANGPLLITNVMQRICGTTKTNKMTRNVCNGFNVYDPFHFYALTFYSFMDAFDQSSGKLEKVMKQLERSTIAHMSNKLSSKVKVAVDSPVAYGVLAELYCPKVYHSLGTTF